MKPLKLIVLMATLQVCAQGEQQLRFCLNAEPKTFDPVLVEEEAGEAIRYLTGGVLVRVNRQTQELESELALSWKVSEAGRTIALRLRQGVTFSDGTPFSSDDVAYTFRRLMDPALHSPTGDAFRSAKGNIEIRANGADGVTLRFPAPVAGLTRLFDQVAIMSAHSARKEMAVLGPFHLKEHKAGSYVLLARNSNYWKRDSAGRKLPYLDTIRLDIEQNREVELLRFKRGELHLINKLAPEAFDQFPKSGRQSVHDVGPGLDAEFFWFNQAPASPIPLHKRAWFRSAEFRRAISSAINREDISRIVYHSHAKPAVGPVSPANRLWFNTALKAPAHQPQEALRSLGRAGFTFSGGVLRDNAGHPVEFTIMTNSGNKSRERTAVMIQQDLDKIGIRLKVATLDFPSVLERMNRTLDYDACLLGLVNTDPDPNEQMNLLLSSSSMHAWSPKQAKPETAWEAEMDGLMRQQASELDDRKRKSAFDRVQQIVVEQAPIIYLVNQNVLAAVSPAVQNAHPVVLRPQTFWNADRLRVTGSLLQTRR